MRALLRVLIPSWRFFSRPSAVPKLYARAVQGGQLGSSWLPVLTPPRLRWYSLFINPEGNLYHASCNALEHLLVEPNDAEARRIIHRTVKRFLINSRQLEANGAYQFKVSIVQLFDGKAVEEDILTGEGEL